MRRNEISFTILWVRFHRTRAKINRTMFQMLLGGSDIGRSAPENLRSEEDLFVQGSDYPQPCLFFRR